MLDKPQKLIVLFAWDNLKVEADGGEVGLTYFKVITVVIRYYEGNNLLLSIHASYGAYFINEFGRVHTTDGQSAQIVHGGFPFARLKSNINPYAPSALATECAIE